MSQTRSEVKAVSTADTRIRNVRPLLSPSVLADDFPASESISAFVAASRQHITRILRGEDHRLLVVVGPCSIHDPEAALEYAQRLKSLADQLQEKLYIVLRVYLKNRAP